MARSKPRRSTSAPKRSGTLKLRPAFSGQLRSEQLRTHLLQMLTSRSVGERLPSERQIATDTGLSLLTVNKVLSGLAAQGLVERRLGAGTYVSGQAPPAERKALRVLRFVIRDLEGVVDGGQVGYLARFYRGVCECAARDGIEVLPTRFEIRPGNLEALPADAFEHPGVEGLIFVEIQVPDYTRLWSYLAAGRRIVGMDFAAPERGLSSVLFDNSGATRRITAHCIEQGHRRLAYLGPDGYAGQPLDERVAGFREALAEAGLDAGAAPVVLGSPETLPQRTLELLKQESGRRPTAVLGCSDFYLSYALEAARALSLEVPRDLSVAGFGGAWRQDRFAPRPLDTVCFDELEMGRMAYRLLRSGARGVVKRQPGRLEVRGSVAPP